MASCKRGGLGCRWGFFQRGRCFSIREGGCRDLLERKLLFGFFLGRGRILESFGEEELQRVEGDFFEVFGALDEKREV